MGKEINAALAIGSGAAILAAIALVRKGASPAQASQELNLDEPTTELLVAIAQGVISIETAIASLGDTGGGIGGPGWPPNAEHVMATRIAITALNKGHQLPSIAIPDDFQILLRGWWANGGIIYVGGSESESVNINTTWPLLPNDIVGYRIQNANTIWISGTTVTDSLVLTVEQRQR